MWPPTIAASQSIEIALIVFLVYHAIDFQL